MLIVVLGLVLLAEYFIVSSYVRFEYVVSRFMSEVPVLSEADKVETYVRSFQNAVELSLLQGLYDIKDQSQGLWYEYPNPNIPDEITIQNYAIGNTTKHVNEYLTDYFDFAQKNAEDITIPLEKVRGGNIIKWENKAISIEFTGITFSGNKGDLKIDRVFKPIGRVRTQFKNIWDLTNALVRSDEIGEKIRKKIGAGITSETDCNMGNTNIKVLVEDALNNEKTTFNDLNKDKNIELTLESTEVSSVYDNGVFSYCKVIATVKVKMEDRLYKYPVFNVTKVVGDYLGLIYRIKTGNSPSTATTSTSASTSTSTSTSASTSTSTSTPATTTIQETCRSIGGRCLTYSYCEQIGGQCIEQYDCNPSQCCCFL
jgi:hypothetical protein